jgi:hypothetical protein
MGTPRLLKAADQMSRMQINASVGGECALDSVFETANRRVPDSGLGATRSNAMDVAFTL